MAALFAAVGPPENPGGALRRVCGCDGSMERAGAAADFAESRAKREHYEAALAELKFKAQAQELLPVEMVARKVPDAFAKLASRLLQLPGQHAQDWFAAESVHELEVMVDSTFRDAMREFRLEILGIEIESGERYPELKPKVEA